MGTVAASGGYYIAAATDRIIANRDPDRGIGVIMEMANFEGLMKKSASKGGHQERAPRDVGSFAQDEAMRNANSCNP